MPPPPIPPGLATSVAAFVGTSRRGPIDQAVRLRSFGDFERRFGGLSPDSEMTYAVRHFFLNGGRDACAVRVARDARPARLTLTDAAGRDVLEVTAVDPGPAGNAITVAVDHATPHPDRTFQLTPSYAAADYPADRATETFTDVTLDPAGPRFVEDMVNGASALVRVRALTGDGDAAASRPAPGPAGTALFLEGGAEESAAAGDAPAVFLPDRRLGRGLFALDAVDLFNLLCLPGVSDPTVLAGAAAYCQQRRAFLLADPPLDPAPASGPRSLKPPAMLQAAAAGALPRSDHAAVYYPWVTAPNPLRGGSPRLCAPSGFVAGLFARTDRERGVWKAPAGASATLLGALGPDVALTAAQLGTLGGRGVNCLRVLPAGTVAWGARTLQSEDADDPEFRYVPVRRLALNIAESLHRGLQWVVFEPNGEPLWAQIRGTIGNFLHGLFRRGAFLGRAPREAYFVRCDGTTTTQNDIDQGVIHVVVGFAPLKPAEFVVLRIALAAGTA